MPSFGNYFPKINCLEALYISLFGGWQSSKPAYNSAKEFRNPGNTSEGDKLTKSALNSVSPLWVRRAG